MAKIKPPVWPELSPESGSKKSAAKAPLGHGVAAYQNTIKRTVAPPEPIEPKQTADRTPKAPRLTEENPFLKLPSDFSPQVLPREKEYGAPREEESKIRRVAKFLILIGGDEAAGILSKLDIEQVEAISREIASIRGIPREEAAEIFAEFRALLSSNYGFQGAGSGGVEEARRLLYAAFGPEKGMEFLKRALPSTKESPLSFMEAFSGEQIAFLLKTEYPMTSAMILSRLPPPLAAAALANTDPGRKLEIVRCIARQGQTSPMVLEQVAGALREKARKLGSVNAENQANVDGRNALAAILKQSDLSFGDRLLAELDEEDPELSQELKDRLHTLEDVIKAEDRPLQEKLRSMPDTDVALLLKGKTPEFTDKIFANVSAQRRAVIREEMQIMGPVPRRDVDAAAKAFLTWFRVGREDGTILLLDDEDVIV
ncbi:flagellar motor switch protein FliG [Spirochaetia bacterium]|nr:flagellar motor switch protein FliG [Spirochaetia bacterium]